ncbi:MAG: NUDIX hydrolase [Rhodoferax sp.]
MELKTDPPVVLRDAATIVMLRDTPQGLEVFLIKRHGLSDVLGGAYVFPGGKLDASDAHVDAVAHLDQDPATLHAALAEPELVAGKATGLYVAALREAFEESGVLLTQDPAAARAALADQRKLPFNQLLHAHGLRLQTSAMLPWARWITPVVPWFVQKRFDARFFVAAVPPDQEARHDDHEATESVWLAPRRALEQYWSGQIELAPPQILSLAHLTRFATVRQVQDAARATRPPVILPQAFEEDGTRVLYFPGGARHPLRERALPGITELRFRNQRFEPSDGFDSLFS